MTMMETIKALPLRSARISADPDTGPLGSVTLPITWDDVSARAMLDLSLSQGPLTFDDAIMPWLTMIQANIRGDENLGVERSREFLDLLLQRQVAPTAGLWQGQHDRQGGFIVNVASFCGHGVFDGPGYVAALRRVCDTLREIHAHAGTQLNGELPLFDTPEEADISAAPPEDALLPRRAGTLLLTNIDAALAALGFDYDSDAGRDAACYMAWLTTSVARQNAGPVPLPPASCPIAGLAAIGEQIRDEIDHADDSLPSQPLIETGFSAPGPIDCILGVDACGFTPIFSPLNENGALRASTLARLAYKGFTPETALAAAFAGQTPFTQPDISAHLAMHRAVAGFVDRMPARPDPTLVLSPQSRLERGQRRLLPHRLNGVSMRVSIGGQRLYLRTGEFDDGSLGEVTINAARGNSMVKGLIDSFNQAVSIGLQYGVPLDVYVDQFAYARYGIGGTVEGDAAANHASSITDYVFRSLSETYLGVKLPDISPESEHDPMSSADPFLPFEADAEAGDRDGAHRQHLRVV